MQQRLSLVTLAVADIARSRRFYEALGWTPSFSNDDVAFYQLNGIVLGLVDRDAMAKDLGVDADRVGVGGVAVAYNVSRRDEVDAAFAEAREAGARVIKEPKDASWGGYSGYFADPDGHPWEVAWNPDWTLSEDGSVNLP